MDYEYLLYRHEFRESILQLQTHLWGTDLALNSAYFAWKYESNPYSPAPLLTVAVGENKVVGVRGFHGAQWQSGQLVLKCFCACDLVVDPAHRNRNIHKRVTDLGLRELSSQGHSMVFNFSANPANYLTSLRTGWKPVMPFRTVRYERRRAKLVRRVASGLRRAPFVWRCADRIAGISGNTGVRGLDGSAFLPLPGGKLQVAAKPDPVSLSEIAQSCQGQGLAHVRTREYFAWRFENPMNDYRFLLSEPEPGYMVLQSRRDAAHGRVNLVDWQAPTDGALLEMLKALIGCNSVQSVAVWASSVPESLRGRMAGLGFFAVDESRGVPSYVPGLLIKQLGTPAPVSPDPDRVMNSALWDLRMIYSDSF
jgi:hypothetical protein